VIPSENIGTVLEDNTIVWKRQMSVNALDLWNAVATRQGLNHWFMPTRFEVTQGGRFSFEKGWDGIISDITPRHHIQFDADGGGGGYLRFEIEVNDHGCLFSLTDRMSEGLDAKLNFWPATPLDHLHQPGGPGAHWNSVAAGYHRFVDSLESHITGASVNSDYDELCDIYRAVLDDHYGPDVIQ
jgi:uncharacterized protein YndB with AHSA1/START domain